MARIVKKLAKGGDSRAQGVASALGEALYAVLDESSRSRVDEVIAHGVIKFDTEEEDSEQAPKEIVNLIIELIAQDSPTDGIKRLVKMSQDVYDCIRKSSETPADFACRFRGLASRYLTHCYSEHAHHDDHLSQNFATLMIENARLSSSTYNAVVAHLVATSKEQGISKKFKTVSILQRNSTTLLPK